MFTTPALLMRAKKKESIFKDCWPLSNYSLKMIPELTEPIYVAPTTAQKTMQVVFQDKAPPIEVGCFTLATLAFGAKNRSRLPTQTAGLCPL